MTNKKKPKELPMIHKQYSVLSNKKSDTQPKELDWEKTFYDNFCSRERNPYSNETFYIVDGNERNPEKYLKFIQSLLTQQRTELLEEIPKKIKGKNKEFVEGYNNAIDDITNLINKKDESIK